MSNCKLPSEPRRPVSEFLDPRNGPEAGSLAILHLSRDNLIPLYLKSSNVQQDGYAEGAVVNTRFGSFPHNTIVGVPWGSQIRASKVDTGSRGRKKQEAKPDSRKLKTNASNFASEEDSWKEVRGTKEEKEAPGTSQGVRNTAAQAGKAEANGKKRKNLRTADDDKRLGLTDQPTEKEAGRSNKKKRIAEDDAGMSDGKSITTGTSERPNGVKQAITATSGFLHVLPPTPELWTASLPHRTQVVYTPDYSYILHRIRARPGTQLIEAGAGSGSFSHASARAVYNGYPREGEWGKGRVYSFEFNKERYKKMKEELMDHHLSDIVQLTHRDVYRNGFLLDGESPKAEAVFLDLPAPWQALPHLSRKRPAGQEGEKTWISPLNPKKTAHICTFSPCIEQVMRTVSAMRRLGWVDIEMVEIANRRINVTRERIGLSYAPDRGVNIRPKSVDEAVARLIEIEERARAHAVQQSLGKRNLKEPMEVDEDGGQAEPAKPWMEGRLVTRGETELKAHTSYLVFAVLPREWTEEDEAAALARWPLGAERQIIGSTDKESRKQAKQEMFQRKSIRKEKKTNRDGVDDDGDTTVQKK